MERMLTGPPDVLTYRVRGPLPLACGAIDRAADRRSDPAWLDERWGAPGAHLLLVGDGEVPVDDDRKAVRWVSTDVVPVGSADVAYLLGIDGDDTYFALPASIAELLGPPEPTAGLRELGPLLGARDASLATHAIALTNWHATHPRCPRCGDPTVVTDGGHIRRCSSDGSEHFPRTDPAMIVLVTDDQDRGLLARQAAWPNKRFSTLAGFVEPGESLEQAVVREVREESGITVVQTAYAASQPWPFPSSLMVGFYARAGSTEISVDGAEVIEARWFSRSDLCDAIETGELLPPSEISIARRLLEGWYGDVLPDGPAI